ncbi:MAG: alpha/beta hydrolase [Clostridia bacterium]|nr:alpha/beta hydrolase [Clostridia bacterium]
MKLLNSKKRTTKRVILSLMVFFLVFLICNFAFSAVFFKVAFGRYDYDGISIELSYDSTLSAYPREPIEFYSGKNKLCGYLYGEKNSVGLVLIAGGMRSTADSHLPEIMHFVDNGFCVLAYDGTGMNNSEGKGMVGLSQPKRDILSAIEYIECQPSLKNLPILIYGHSAGGYGAITATEHKNVTAVVSIGGFESPIDMMMCKANQYAGIFAKMGYPFLLVQNSITFGKDANVSATDIINSTSTPALIINGAYDAIVPFECSLASHSDEIINPNVTCVTLDNEYRSEHSSMWLSEEAVIYRNNLQSQIQSLSESYKGDIPQDALESFKQSVNYTKANTLDYDFMAMITAFYLRAIENK